MNETFTVKDSGQRKQFESGMVRDTNENKVLWHLVAAGPMLFRWAMQLTRGARKYSANNWMKAAGQEELDRFRESAFRHFMQWYNGERDEDHAAAVFFNINGAEFVRENRKDVPDPKADKPKVRVFRDSNAPDSVVRWLWNTASGEVTLFANGSPVGKSEMTPPELLSFRFEEVTDQ